MDKRLAGSGVAVLLEQGRRSGELLCQPSGGQIGVRIGGMGGCLLVWVVVGRSQFDGGRLLEQQPNVPGSFPSFECLRMKPTAFTVMGVLHTLLPFWLFALVQLSIDAGRAREGADRDDIERRNMHPFAR